MLAEENIGEIACVFGWESFSKLMDSCQIGQFFLLSTFHAIRYTSKLLVANIFAENRFRELYAHMYLIAGKLTGN